MKYSLFVFCFVSILFSSLSAQSYVKIKNRWKKDGKTDYRIHIERSTVDAGATQPGWWSQQWILEKVPNTPYYKFRNRWKKDGKTNYYLHIEYGKIQAGAIKPGWWSAQWKLEKIPNSKYYRIRNRWKPNQFLHIEGPKLAAGTIKNEWWSAQWELEGFRGTGTAPRPQVSNVSWIYRHYDRLKEKPLNQLVLPGSHDAGTYNLSSTWNNSVNDPFAPDTDDKKRGLSFLGDGYDKWAKAQEKTIYQQLVDGVRYIDIRVCVDKSNRLKTCHGLYGASLTTVINDVVKFTNQYPKEPILLDFNHFYDWYEKSRNGKENEAGYQGIRQAKLDELAGMIQRTIGSRLAPNSLNPTSKVREIIDINRPIIVFWSKPLRGSFQQRYFWSTGEIASSWSGSIQEIRVDKLNHLRNKIQANQNSSRFFNLVGQITPSTDLYTKSYDRSGNFPFGLQALAKETNPVVLSYVANEWKNYRHNIISVDFYNQSGLVDLCKKLNGIPASPRGVSLADRKRSTWGNWNLGITDIFVSSPENEWKVEIDACHSDLDNTQTGNRITVDFYNGSNHVMGRYKNGVSSGCKIWEGDATFTLMTTQNITHVIVRTNGDDGFYIDELRLYKGGNLKKHHGRDNGSGWCLSTDPNDARGSWKGKVAGNTCRSSHRFDY